MKNLLDGLSSRLKTYKKVARNLKQKKKKTGEKLKKFSETYGKIENT